MTPPPVILPTDLIQAVFADPDIDVTVEEEYTAVFT